ncbi:PucR family transcriptional regulator [Aquibacillus sediminis]|uniref:PucR family transcriptional regulator n=1 Tax=Aquibacillus sediminis TaxID=2574734 RepID=UPI00110884A2|nr:PucR family transcriptional regulator [Aquibacillus sediminis]
MSSLTLTVADILDRPIFKHAKLLAGREGLQHTIRWVHVIEVTEISQLLSGNEFILSTGVSWQGEPDRGLAWLQQLIANDAAGLCVELGTYMDEIPEAMIELAEEKAFPLIIFDRKVRFIDITQELNRLQLEKHYQLISDLEWFSNRLNHLLLKPNSFQKILRLFSDYVNAQVVYVGIDGDTKFFPPVKKNQQLSYMQQFEAVYDSSSQDPTVMFQPIEAVGHKIADLVVFVNEHERADFVALLLERTVTAIAQEKMRILYVEEKQKHRQEDWGKAWLKGEHTEEEVENYLLTVDPKLQPAGYCTCLCKVAAVDEETDMTYYTTIFSSILKQKGFLSMIIVEGNHLIFALVNKREQTNWKQRLREAFQQMEQTDLIADGLFDWTSVSIGKLVEDSESLSESYLTAKDTRSIQQQLALTKPTFYDELYIYQYLWKLKKENELQHLIAHIEPVLEYDQHHKGQMLPTLEMFLQVNGSKKEAAEHLYIVRQTLYHRIEKLKELLGGDFMEQEKRIMIELAIKAYRLQKNPSNNVQG